MTTGEKKGNKQTEQIIPLEQIISGKCKYQSPFGDRVFIRHVPPSGDKPWPRWVLGLHGETLDVDHVIQGVAFRC